MALSKLEGKAICYVNLDEVHKEAKEKGITRSMAAVERACSDNVDIFVFGNAPTALFKLKELIKISEKIFPNIMISIFSNGEIPKEWGIDKLDNFFSDLSPNVYLGITNYYKDNLLILPQRDYMHN